MRIVPVKGLAVKGAALWQKRQQAYPINVLFGHQRQTCHLKYRRIKVCADYRFAANAARLGFVRICCGKAYEKTPKFEFKGVDNNFEG